MNMNLIKSFQASTQKYNAENGIITVNFIDYDQGVSRQQKRQSRLEYMREYNRQKTIRLRKEREQRKQLAQSQ